MWGKESFWSSRGANWFTQSEVCKDLGHPSFQWVWRANEGEGWAAGHDGLPLKGLESETKDLK